MSLRNSSTRRARSAWGSAALEISFRKMMLVRPSGPITLISAVGHATITSVSYARPHMTKYPAPYALRSTTVSFGTVVAPVHRVVRRVARRSLQIRRWEVGEILANHRQARAIVLDLEITDAGNLTVDL